MPVALSREHPSSTCCLDSHSPGIATAHTLLPWTLKPTEDAPGLFEVVFQIQPGAQTSSHIKRHRLPPAEISPVHIISDTSSIVTRVIRGPAGDAVGYFCTEHIPGVCRGRVNMIGGLPSPCHSPCTPTEEARQGSVTVGERRQLGAPRLGLARPPPALK